MTIKPIPQDEKVSSYQLASVLEACAKALKDMPRSVISEVEYEESEAYTRIENIVRGVNNRLVQLEKAIADSEEAMIKAVDEHYERTSKLVSNANKRLAQLPAIESGARLPYNADEIFKIAERFNGLNDEQWVRVIELAKALSNTR